MLLRKQQADSAWFQEEETRKRLKEQQMSPPLREPQISPPLQPKMAPPNTATTPVQRKTSFLTPGGPTVMYLFVQLLFQMMVTSHSGRKECC